MKMFRSLRFCYFLTDSYRKLGNVAPVKLKGICRKSTASSAANLRREKITSYYGENLQLQSEGDPLSNIRYSKSGAYWLRFLTSDRSDIVWDECLAAPEVPQENYTNTYAIIFLICLKKKFHKCAISLFKYLWDKKEITPGLLNLFCEMMLECPEAFRCCEDMIFKIFLHVIKTNKTSIRICLAVLLQSSKYSEIVYDYYKNCINTINQHSPVIASLLEAKKISEALELYKMNKCRVLSLEKMFLDYFLLQTMQNDPPVADIIKFLGCLPNFSSDISFSEENTKILITLFKKLRELDKDYFWMVNKGQLSPTCSYCKGKLTLADVTQEEINLLLKDLEERVIIQDNIFIKTNRKEWKRFCDFIESVNYTLVMDGLNVKYALKDYVKFEGLINKLTAAGLTPLLLGRLYFQRCPEFQLVMKKKYPVFLTDDLSDDDVFVLYAALKKGKGCYTLTNDKMTFCNNLLSSEKYLSIFRRWQATHQCKLTFSKSFTFPPFIMNGVQQCADNKEGEFRYHYVSSYSLYPKSMTCVSRIRKDRAGKF